MLIVLWLVGQVGAISAIDISSKAMKQFKRTDSIGARLLQIAVLAIATFLFLIIGKA